MTKKLNLNPLIKHFSAKDEKIANRLVGLTKTAKSTNEFSKIAQALIEIGNELDHTNPTLASEADALLQEIVKEAQGFSAEKGKQISDSFKGTNKPSILDQAGNWIAKQIKDRNEKLNSGSGQKLMGEECMGGSKCMDESHDHQDSLLAMDGGSKLMDKGTLAEDDEPSIPEEDIVARPPVIISGDKLMDEEEEISVEILDPEIEEMEAPSPEYDMVALDDIRESLANMKFRISDKKRREALEEAIEHIEKAMDYDKASKSRRDKVHEIFDGAGLQLRLKDFE